MKGERKGGRNEGRKGGWGRKKEGMKKSFCYLCGTPFSLARRGGRFLSFFLFLGNVRYLMLAQPWSIMSSSRMLREWWICCNK